MCTGLDTEGWRGAAAGADAEDEGDEAREAPLQGVQGVAGDDGGVRHEHTHGVRRPSSHVMIVGGAEWLLGEQEDDGGEECEAGLTNAVVNYNKTPVMFPRHFLSRLAYARWGRVQVLW